MLEFPESYTIAREIRETLLDKEIEEIEIGHTPHKFAFFKGDKEKYSDMLIGHKIKNSVNRGGIIEIDTEDSMILLGDGTNTRYYQKGVKLPAKRQFVLYFSDSSYLCVFIQMYGEIGVFPLGECDYEYFNIARSKPDPLSSEFTYNYFKSMLKRDKKISAKAFLATEQRIPGLGNGVLQDILWNVGLNPRYDMRNISEEKFRRLYAVVKSTLFNMCRDGGRDTEKDLFGNQGGYVTKLSKNTVNKPCIKCGHIIHKESYLGGTVYYCEHCQSKKLL